MIIKKTVLVMGAGSAPVGFPSGSGLFWEIVNHQAQRKSNENVFKLLNDIGVDYQSFEVFRQELEYSGKESVDAFLEHRKEFIEVGKKAIAGVLIPNENISRLFVNNQEVRNAVFHNWYRYLFDRMNSSFPEFGSNNIVFVTFNYDRSLEYFLLNSLRKSYGKDEKEAAGVLSKIPIIHIHGQLGAPSFFGEKGRDYNTEISPEHVAKSANEIYIAHDEDIANRQQTKDAIRHIREAERLFFLGFGWNEVNLRRLGIPKIGQKTLVGGTAFGMKENEMKHITKLFKEGGTVFTPYYTGCLEALRESGVLM